MRFIHRAITWISYYLGAAAFFLASLILNAFCLLALVPRNRNRFASPLRSLVHRLLSWFLRVTRRMRILSIDTPPIAKSEFEKPCVWVMNHPSMLDGIYLLKFIWNGVFIYKQSIGSNPFYGGIARLARYIPNSGGPDMIRKAVDRLNEGTHVMIFPEGTRTTRMDPSKITPSFALIAARARVPVNVLWLDNPLDFMTKESKRWIPPQLMVDASIQKLGTILPSPRERAAQLRDRVANIYAKHLETCMR